MFGAEGIDHGCCGFVLAREVRVDLFVLASLQKWEVWDYPGDATQVQSSALVEDGFFLVLKSRVSVYVLPLFYQQQLPLPLLALCSSCQSVTRDEHLCPRCTRGSIFFLCETAVYTNYIYSSALEYAVRDVLNTPQSLQSRDASADDGDAGAVKADFELQMCGDVAEPRFARWNRPYAAERLVLNIDALCGVSVGLKRFKCRFDETSQKTTSTNQQVSLKNHTYHDHFRQFAPASASKVLRRIVLEKDIKACLIHLPNIFIAVEIQERTVYLLTVSVAWYIVGTAQSMSIVRCDDDFGLPL